MRPFALAMVVGGFLLLLLGLVSLAGHQNEAGLVGATLAIAASALVIVIGLVYLLLTREHGLDHHE